jgi:hypothetical protein
MLDPTKEMVYTLHPLVSHLVTNTIAARSLSCGELGDIDREVRIWLEMHMFPKLEVYQDESLKNYVQREAKLRLPWPEYDNGNQQPAQG